MIDPITIGAAFAVAKGAVAGIKQALELGHEIKDCYQDLQSFFHSQAEIEKAAKTVEVVKTQPKSEDPKQAAEQESGARAFTSGQVKPSHSPKVNSTIRSSSP